ncbi:hypothetical protein NDU88_002682 [Pleurodeles waltl]|uniref:Uncharacterized protein n=1 Tax=Pleurodeles waltl TaxID=8319 RepID=A0AAV7RGA3_PLEWA|nr:hypothetical protein NDU88_002682 [Pleurodeles waltl]
MILTSDIAPARLVATVKTETGSNRSADSENSGWLQEGTGKINRKTPRSADYENSGWLQEGTGKINRKTPHMVTWERGSDVSGKPDTESTAVIKEVIGVVSSLPTTYVKYFSQCLATRPHGQYTLGAGRESLTALQM